LICFLEIGVLDTGDQTILENWYSTLTNKAGVNWTTGVDLCTQDGVTCDTSNPQRITQLYSFLINLKIKLMFNLFSII